MREAFQERRERLRVGREQARTIEDDKRDRPIARERREIAKACRLAAGDHADRSTHASGLRPRRQPAQTMGHIAQRIADVIGPPSLK